MRPVMHLAGRLPYSEQSRISLGIADQFRNFQDFTCPLLES